MLIVLSEMDVALKAISGRMGLCRKSPGRAMLRALSVLIIMSKIV